MQGRPARRQGKGRKWTVLPAGTIGVFLIFMSICVQAQTSLPVGGQAPQLQVPRPAFDPVGGLLGLPIEGIRFEGVSPSRLDPLPPPLAKMVGTPLTRENLSEGLRAVFASGLFETVEAEGVQEGVGVVVIFKGAPRTFIGTVSVYGAKGATMNAQLERASRLNPGTRFTERRLQEALDRMRQTLADNGFHEPKIDTRRTQKPEQQLVNLAFQVDSGPQARIGSIEVTGDSGMSAEDFRRAAHLRLGARVDHDTASRALSGVLAHYRKQNRLEAEIKVEAQNYSVETRKEDFRFSANRGPVVKVRLEGAGIGSDRLKHAIPIYEEGTVDDDLLNEGNRRLRDYFQRLGYFDVKVDHAYETLTPEQVAIVYTVTLGSRRKVERVGVEGNHYFDTNTLQDLLSVHQADTLDRHGTYSQSLVAADVSALEAVYQNNGFSGVKVTPETTLADPPSNRAQKPAGVSVVYHITEGVQQRVGKVALEGNDHFETAKLLALMNTAPGQLYSPQNLAGDRDALLTEYINRGFNQASIDIEQKTEPGNPNMMDIVFHVTEGQQIFVRDVVVTGLQYVRPDAVERVITIQPGDPLSQAALIDTQRNLYDFGLFNEVDTAVENPSGAEPHKTVLVQTTEARRWTLAYGFGFEAQTGQPQNNCAGFIAAGTGTQCSPNGKTGISPRVLASITRNALFGREQSASIQGTYGLLEQKINLIFQNPHFFGRPNLAMSFTGGYANSQDVTTYVASKLDAGLRWTERFSNPSSFFSRANTFVYEFDFRRVKVAATSLQVYPAAIPELSAAVRVAGPGVTWIRDTRDSALDAHRGTYSSFQDFYSTKIFGAEVNFNRVDVSNSSFYSLDKNRFVIARNTRYAQERAYGEGSDQLIPLPERLYAGGPTSLRGFSVNAAGPRDPETGYPIGGAGALVNSTELRLPPPILPWLGNSVSFVLFHDMGNVFTNAGDAWESAIRLHQPDRDNCKVLTQGTPQNPPAPSGNTEGPDSSTGQQGICGFNYFSHAPGIGVRYHTPVGPIRLDFSYNLNPPMFPINVNYSQSNPYLNPHVGEASHFNFVFSLGQTF